MNPIRWRQSTSRSKRPSAHTWKKKHDRAESCSCADSKMMSLLTSCSVLLLSSSQMTVQTLSRRSRSDTFRCKPAACSEHFTTRCSSLGLPSWVLLVRPARTVDAILLCCFHRVYKPLWVSRHSGMPTGYHRDCEQVFVSPTPPATAHPTNLDQ